MGFYNPPTSLPPSGAAGGDLSGTYPNPTVAAIGGQAVTLGGAVTFSGAFATTFTVSSVTAVTLPTSGTLAILAGNTFTSAQAINAGTVAVSTPVLNMTQTWADGGTNTVVFTGIKLAVTNTNSSSSSLLLDLQVGGGSVFSVLRGGATVSTGVMTALSGTAIPAGGTVAYKFSSTSLFGIFMGSGVPSCSAAQGSIYLRSDGSSTSTRAYINTTGSTTWTNLTTAA